MTPQTATKPYAPATKRRIVRHRVAPVRHAPPVVTAPPVTAPTPKKLFRTGQEMYDYFMNRPAPDPEINALIMRNIQEAQDAMEIAEAAQYAEEAAKEDMP